MPPPAYTPRKRWIMQGAMWAILGVALAAASVARPLGGAPGNEGDRLRRQADGGSGGVAEAPVELGPMRRFGPVVLPVPAGWSALTPRELEASDPGDDGGLPPGTVALMQDVSPDGPTGGARGVRQLIVTVERPPDGDAATGRSAAAEYLHGLYPATRGGTWPARLGDHPAAGADFVVGVGRRDGREVTLRHTVVCAVTPAGRVVLLSMVSAGTARDADRALLAAVAEGGAVVE